MTDTEAVGTVTMTTTEFQAFMDRAAREARADGAADQAHRMAVDTMRVHDDAMAEGRADALREAADAVRALDAPKYDGDTWTKDCEHGWDTHEAAVLDLLDPQP